MPRLLSLDISESVGWCLLEPGRPPRFDTWRQPRCVEGEYGRQGSALFDWLTELVMVMQPRAIAAEAPLIPNKFSGMDTTTHTVLFLSGSVYIAEMVAHRAGVPFLRVHHDDAKIALCGRAKGVSKAAMKAAAVEKKWIVSTEHEADAIGVGLHAYEVFFPARAA